MQYKRRNNLLMHSAELPHAQQWTSSVLEASIFETSKYIKNLTVYRMDLLQWHFHIGHIVFSSVHFLASTR